MNEACGLLSGHLLVYLSRRCFKPSLLLFLEVWLCSPIRFIIWVIP
jgi:hypothetical protein